LAEHEATEAWCGTVLEDLLRQATAIGGKWIAKHYENKSTAPKSEWGNYWVRARLHKGSLMIDWYRLKKANVSVTTAAGTKNVLLGDHIKKGRGPQYSARALRHAMPWEQALFEELEPQFAKLREQARDINRLRGLYRRYKRKYKKSDTSL